MRKNTAFIIAMVAFVIIAGMSVYVITRMVNNEPMSNNTTSSAQNTAATAGMVDENSSDYKVYSHMQGEQYDQAFIANMIAHHEGAVEMAKLALTNAKHQEIKDMANDIIAAQTTEINEMLAWQSEWGYPSSSGDAMEDHSAMAMMEEMDHMNGQLETLSGDAFDKAFLSSMIQHHQSAINMAYPGMTNAYHQEVKTLTKNIVDAQSGEIAQMMQWQQEWGY